MLSRPDARKPYRRAENHLCACQPLKSCFLATIDQKHECLLSYVRLVMQSLGTEAKNMQGSQVYIYRLRSLACERLNDSNIRRQHGSASCNSET